MSVFDFCVSHMYVYTYVYMLYKSKVSKKKEKEMISFAHNDILSGFYSFHVVLVFSINYDLSSDLL